jgi:hypothetical protein
MKIPKTFDKMNLDQQEAWLVNKLMKMQLDVEALRRLLAKVRGGNKIDIQMDDRPDEIALKEA